MKTPSRHIAPYIVAAAVAAFLIFLAYVMFFVPKMNETKALEDQTATVTASNELLAAKVAVIGENAENIGNLEDRVKEFNAAFPAGSSQQDLMNAVARAASESGVVLTTLNPAVPSVALVAAAVEEDGAVETGEADVDAALESVQTEVPAAEADQEGSGVAMVALTINAKGSPTDLRVFMEKLEAMDRPILVKTFGFEGQGSETNLNLTAESFFVAPLVNPDSKEETAVDEEPETAPEAPVETVEGQ